MRLECRSLRTGTAYAAHTTPKHFFNDRLISIQYIIKGDQVQSVLLIYKNIFKTY